MKTAALVALLFLAVSGEALGDATGSITVEPRGTIYLDDLLVIETRPPEGSGCSDLVLESGNLTINGPIREAQRSGEKGPLVPLFICTFHATPNALGPAWVQGQLTKFSYTTGIHAKFGAPFSRIPFVVKPALSGPGKAPARIFADQTAAKRTLLFAQTSVNRQQAFVGQFITARWDLVTPDERIQPMGFYPKVDGIEKVDNPPTGNAEIHTAAGGMIVWQRRLAEMTFTAQSPGIIHIPSSVVDVGKQLPNGETQYFRTLSIPVDVEFLALPAAVGKLPLGQFTMKCTAEDHLSQWPSFTVEITGDGDLRNAPMPHFEIESSVPIVAASYTRTMRTRSWNFFVHTYSEPEMQLPAVTFDYFDVQSGSAKQLYCPPTRSDRPSDFYHPPNVQVANQTNARREQKQSDALIDTDTGRLVAGAFAAFGLLMVLAAARPL
jgi:hypothetical protein